MPGGDRTGPQGMGPMTGRAAGYCAGYDSPAYANPGFGRGYRIGRGYGGGGGRGRRNMYYATGLPGWARYGEPDPDAQKQSLKNQANALQAHLDLVKKRLSDLEADIRTE